MKDFWAVVVYLPMNLSVFYFKVYTRLSLSLSNSEITLCYSKLACFGFKQKSFALQDSNHYVFEQKTFRNMRKGTPISIIDKMSCLLLPFAVSELFCFVMFGFFFLDP